MSIRGDIVDKVATRIPAGAGVTPETTFKNPFREIAESELPCLKVALMRGRSSEINTRIEYQNEDTLIVAWVDQGNDGDLEDRLYQAAEDITDFLINDANDSGTAAALHHLISDLEFTGWDMDLKTGAAGTGAIVLNFNITYHTTHEIVFGDLEGVDIDIRHTEAADSDIPIFQESIDLPTE